MYWEVENSQLASGYHSCLLRQFIGSECCSHTGSWHIDFIRSSCSSSYRQSDCFCHFECHCDQSEKIGRGLIDCDRWAMAKLRWCPGLSDHEGTYSSRSNSGSHLTHWGVNMCYALPSILAEVQLFLTRGVCGHLHDYHWLLRGILLILLFLQVRYLCALTMSTTLLLHRSTCRNLRLVRCALLQAPRSPATTQPAARCLHLWHHWLLILDLPSWWVLYFPFSNLRFRDEESTPNRYIFPSGPWQIDRVVYFVFTVICSCDLGCLTTLLDLACPAASHCNLGQASCSQR